MRRVAFSMTVDPEGAMHDWVDLPDGWQLQRVPTQEAVHLLGIEGYQEVLIDLCERERPDLLVTHPPYDYLTLAIAERIREAGTRIVGYAFDDEIFACHYTAATRAALQRIYDRYVTTREVRWATAPLPQVPPQPEEFEVVLVGRAYARRRELVGELNANGIRVVVRGHGWPEGFVSRREMLALYARAAVVLTTSDWEDQPVAMVKHRLLDTAMMGVFQIAQHSRDLRDYFTENEVPSYRDAGDLIALLRRVLPDPESRRGMALAARERALAEHTWNRRFTELIAPLSLGTAQPVPEQRSLLLDHLLLALGTRAEADRRTGAAAALFEELLARNPAQTTAAAGLGRCLRDLGRPEEALEWLKRAAAAESPPCAAALHVTLGSFGVGTGMGRLCSFPPAAEPMVYLLALLLELGRMVEACAVLDSLTDPVLARAVAATLELGENPLYEPVRNRLAGMRAPT